MANHTPVVAQVLVTDAPEGHSNPFEERSLLIEVQKDTPATILEKLNVPRGFLCYFGRIIDDSLPAKKWYNGDHPMVVIPVAKDYIEDDEIRNQNSASRLVDGGIPISHALKALGRAHWHRGFLEFSEAATDARKLVEATSRSSYNERTEVVTLDSYKSLCHCGPFRANGTSTPDLILPPHTTGFLDHLQVEGSWQCSTDFHRLSVEEISELQRVGRIWAGRTPHIEEVGKAVVRVFGYHPKGSRGPGLKEAHNEGPAQTSFKEFRVDDSDMLYRARPFTAFFVSPTLLLSTRTARYDTEHNTYAEHFYWTPNTDAMLPLLREGVDLFRCKEVQDVSSFLVEKIRSIGVELSDDKIPPENMAVPWNDLMLLQVDKVQASSHYLLPAMDMFGKGDALVSVMYPEQPTDQWVSGVCGVDGHAMPVGLRELTDLFHGFDRKFASLGHIRDEPDQGMMSHTCGLAPGSVGSPVLHQFEAQISGEKPILTFTGINCGRSVEEITQTRKDIETNSTTPAAVKAAKSLNMYNHALTVQHITFVLLYQEYVLQDFTGMPEEEYLQKFLAPYTVFVKQDVLSSCHKKMLKDAEDQNDWGMAFWEKHDIGSALYCFREGARMFCIATIPDMSPMELKLKDALQSNVSAVVMSKMET